MTVRGMIRAEDVLRCLMFELDPSLGSVGYRTEAGCEPTPLKDMAYPLLSIVKYQDGERSRTIVEFLIFSSKQI
jgi:hypothetical protein